MQDLDQSKLKLYSLGIVLKDKDDDGDFIEVSPIEHLPGSEGNLKETNVKNKTEIPDNKGVKRIVESESTQRIKAKWIPFGQSNRITAPNVYEGETVVLFQFADADEYHWTTIFREPLLRRLETGHYAFSNLSKKGKEFDKETSYWIEVSTKNKHIKLHTANNDGEPFKYDLEFNTGKGFFELKDSAGNSLKLDSNKGEFEINCQKITGNVTDSIDLTASSLNMKIPTITIDGHINISNGISSPAPITAPNID